MKAVSYARVSTEDQADRGTIALQGHVIGKWSEQHGVELVGAYRDEGVSGTTMFSERPSGARLLADLPQLKAQGVTLVLIYKWDRIGRDHIAFWSAVLDLERRGGMRIKSVTEQADTSNPESTLMLAVNAGMATYERQKFAERSRAAVNMLAAEGNWLGGPPPYGYRVVGAKRAARLEIDEAPLPEIDPAFGLSAAEVVRQIYTWSAARETLARICDRLNALGIPPSFRGPSPQPQGSRAPYWQPARLHRLLTNPVYRGEHQFGRYPKRFSNRPPEVIARAVPAIVSPELWHAAQEALQINRRNSGRNQGAFYLLKGLVRCGACGRLYIGRKKRDRPMYYCNGTHRNGNPDGAPCHTPVLPAGPLEAAIWERVERLLRFPELVLPMLQAERRKGQEQGGQIAAQVKRLEDALAARERQRQQIITWARGGIITEIEMAGQLRAIREEEKSLQQQVAELRPQARSAAESEREAEAAEELLRRLGEDLGDDPTEPQKRDRILTLVRKVVVSVDAEQNPRQAVLYTHWRFFRD